MAGSLLLAVDGGNSKTAALALEPTGRVVVRLAGPGSGGGPHHLAAVLGAMLRELPGGPASIAAAAIAAAGIDFAEDAAAFEVAVADLLPAARLRVMNDAVAVLRAAHDGDGVAVVCGAGLNVVAAGPAGLATVPAIDWMSGDRGGGHDLGREAVRIAYRSWDGRGPRSVLEREVPAAAGADDPLQLARLLRDGALGDAVLDRFAPLLTAAAVDGDAAALAVVERLVEEIRLLVRTTSARAWPGRVPTGTPVVLAGGVLRAAGVAGRVIDVLAGEGFVARPLAAPPVLGAAIEVLRLVGARPDAVAAVRDRLGSVAP